MDHKNFPSKRAIKVRKRMANKEFRDTYVEAQNRTLLAHQMRGFRGEKSQAEFGRLIGKPQSVVSRFEDAEYGKWSLQSLHEIGAKTGRALLVKFVSYDDFVSDVENPLRYDIPLPFSEIGAMPFGISTYTIPKTGTQTSIDTMIEQQARPLEDVQNENKITNLALIEQVL